jgi:hypothetical protein
MSNEEFTRDAEVARYSLSTRQEVLVVAKFRPVGDDAAEFARILALAPAGCVLDVNGEQDHDEVDAWLEVSWREPWGAEDDRREAERAEAQAARRRAQYEALRAEFGDDQ